MNASTFLAPRWNFEPKRATSGFMDDEAKARFRRIVGGHLRLAREALGYKSGEFAREAGVSTSTYSQIETGDHLCSLETALSIAERHRLTLDWIYLGNDAGLETKISRAIEHLQKLRASRAD